MVSSGKRGGSRFEKKSFRAVATAFTGMSSVLISTLLSVEKNTKHDGLIWCNERREDY